MPSLALAQDRTEREVVELIVRDGPQARAIRAESEVTRREQLARLAYPNPAVTYSRESAGFTEFLQAEQSLPLFGARAALSRAGVAATAAAEAERDVRLWVLRSDAAAAVARLVAEQARLELAAGHRAKWNGSSRFSARGSARAKALDSIACAPSRSSVTRASCHVGSSLGRRSARDALGIAATRHHSDQDHWRA